MDSNDSKIYFFTEDNIDILNVYDNEVLIETISGFESAILQTGITTLTSKMVVTFTRYNIFIMCFINLFILFFFCL